jgi:hypothetical protein
LSPVSLGVVPDDAGELSPCSRVSSKSSVNIAPNAGRGTTGILSVPQGELPGGRTLRMLTTSELQGIPGIHEWEEERLESPRTANSTERQKSGRLVKAVKRIISERRASHDDESEESDADECLDRFGNVRLPGASPVSPTGDLLSSSTIASTSTSGSNYDGLSPRHSWSTAASARSRGLDGTVFAEIVDLRLFDFALPKNRAKIEITYIEVNLETTFPGNFISFDDQETKKEERIVLRPSQVTKIHICSPKYVDLPIIPHAFEANSGICFPLAQTWTRPKRFKYPADVELTLELMVNNVRCVTKPHWVTLTGTSSMFNYCITQ